MMPLLPGSDPKTISANISELTHHGSIPRKHNQIVEIALSNTDKHPHAAKGGVPGIGSVHPFHLMPAEKAPAISTPHMGLSQESPWWTRSSEREMMTSPHGGIGHFQGGGGVMPIGMADPWWTRNEARQIGD